MDASSSTLTVSFEPGCSTTNNNIYYGRLEHVSSYGYSGQHCDVGMSGTTGFRVDELGGL